MNDFNARYQPRLEQRLAFKVSFPVGILRLFAQRLSK